MNTVEKLLAATGDICGGTTNTPLFWEYKTVTWIKKSSAFI